MCKAFSCIVTQSAQVAWKLGTDSHDSLYEQFKNDMPELLSDYRSAKIEITPNDENYFDAKTEWTFRVDEDEKPSWWTAIHEAAAYMALGEWKLQLYSIVNLNELQNLVNPFEIEPHPVDDEVLKLVEEWIV